MTSLHSELSALILNATYIIVNNIRSHCCILSRVISPEWTLHLIFLILFSYSSCSDQFYYGNAQTNKGVSYSFLQIAFLL